MISKGSGADLVRFGKRNAKVLDRISKGSGEDLVRFGKRNAKALDRISKGSGKDLVNIWPRCGKECWQGIWSGFSEEVIKILKRPSKDWVRIW